MTSPTPRRVRGGGAVAVLATLALAATPLALTAPAQANPAGSGLVVSEVYGGGGNTGATYANDFVELFNPTSAPISVEGWSVQYRSASGSGTGSTPLTGSVPAGGHYLVQEAAGTNPGTALPKPDATGTLAMSGSAGIVALASKSGTVPLTDPTVVDLVGYGTATAFEGTAPAPGLSNTTADTRAASGKDTDDNKTDFTTAAPAPENTGTTTPPPGDPVERTIAQVQGTGATSPYAGQQVITDGVVTAAYPTGGFNGVYLQTAGTGGDVDLATHDASEAVFVFLGGGATYPRVGDHLRVTGTVSEYAGLTELTPGTGGVTTLADAAVAPKPAVVGYPGTDAQRETFEGMLVAPQGPFTVTDNYSTNNFAEIGLAAGTTPLPQPTDVARPGTAADAVAADNAKRRVALDDGASANYLTTLKDTPLPWLTRERSVRVGAAVTFVKPVVLDYRNSAWKLQPTAQLTADDRNDVLPATFTDTRTAAPQAVGGDLKVASFNVLNFFPHTGAAWVASGGTCSFYDDRAGNHVTVNTCSGDGPRGAAEDDDLTRQRAKIVAAINALDADVLSLEEIENSAKYAGPDHRDDALATLVDALNAAAGEQRWTYVPSPAPADRPATADEDVIRTAFIYQKAVAEPVGASHILTGAAAFDNAREPLGQVFRPVGGHADQQFLVIVNHFKSKGSGTDDGTGQGNANPDRVAQAHALVDFADGLKASSGTDRVFLTGDFNSYTQEDPLRVLYDAGYTDVGEAKAPGESTYLFDGVVGSLDHVLANDAMLGDVTGAHVWNINSVESVAYEYSRANYNATDFYAPTPYRSSDHDPLLVGFTLPTAQPVASSVSATSSPSPVVVRQTRPTVTATVTAGDVPATGGTVEVSDGGTVLGSAPVTDGTATVQLPVFAATGTRSLRVAYSGTDGVLASATALEVSVVRATPTMDTSLSPARVVKKKTHAVLTAVLAAPGQTVGGTVEVRDAAGRLLTSGALADGSVRLTLPVFASRGDEVLTVRYLGSDLAAPVSTQVTVTVTNN